MGGSVSCTAASRAPAACASAASPTRSTGAGGGRVPVAPVDPPPDGPPPDGPDGAPAVAAWAARRRVLRGRPVGGSVAFRSVSVPHQEVPGSENDHGLPSLGGFSPGCGVSPIIRPLDYAV